MAHLLDCMGFGLDLQALRLRGQVAAAADTEGLNPSGPWVSGLSSQDSAGRLRRCEPKAPAAF